MGALGSTRGRCLAIPKISISRCWRLALLVIVNLILAEILFCFVSRSPHINKRFPVLEETDPPPIDLARYGRFLKMEFETSDENTASLDGTEFQEEEDDHKNDTALSLCPENPPGLVGGLKVNINPPSLEEQERGHPELALGGHFRPENCTARHKVAIIIPYRDRRSHLTALVHHLHPILQRQLIEYNIYVVEQAGINSFNRGILMNIGFVEAMKQHPFDCIILHDVDLVPENDRNLYACPDPPRHMSAAISSHNNYTLMYSTYFGGVSAMTADQYKSINGFSNEFWGWGGEDDDLYNRVRYKKMNITRYPGKMGRYTMLSHKKAQPNPTRHRVLRRGKRRYKTDGLSSLKYNLLKTERRHLFTWLLVEVKKPKGGKFRH